VISKRGRRSNRRKPEAWRQAALAQPALKAFVSKEMLPDPEVPTDDQMIEEIRVCGVSNLHPVGTSGWVARSTRLSIRGSGFMGRAAARRRRLDHAAGARGNANAPSIMIGEKCAAMILEDAIAA
jgi:choline dehydrogenase